MWDFETRAIHAGISAERNGGATSVPIYESAAFAYKSPEELEEVFAGRRFGYLYGRVANPTVAVFEERVNALEAGVGAIAAASGMAAVATAVGALTRAGDEILASTSLFGGTYHLFNKVFGRHGVGTRYADPLDLDAVKAAVTEKTRLVFVETIGNPKVDVPDIDALAGVARDHGIPLVVDGTLTSPYLFQARDHGTAIAIHSATKYITGSGSAIGGVIVDLGTFDWRTSRDADIRQAATRMDPRFAFLSVARREILQNTGATLDPFAAYLHALGLETLALRMERHCSNALALARFLEGHPAVAAVDYPGLASSPHHEVARRQFADRYGGLLALRLGSRERCFRFAGALELARSQTNLGDAKTLVIHPASTIYRDCTDDERRAAGVTDDLLRVSVGIESPRDIIADFNHALEGVRDGS